MYTVLSDADDQGQCKTVLSTKIFVKALAEFDAREARGTFAQICLGERVLMQTNETTWGREVADVSTEELAALIRQDADKIVTFEARAEYTKRTGKSWRDLAPSLARVQISDVNWHDFHETGTI